MSESQKYGPRNLSLTMDGDDLVMRVDTRGMACNADGTPKLAGTSKGVDKNGKDKGNRSVNLVGTTSGFKSIGSVTVSVNVTS